MNETYQNRMLSGIRFVNHNIICNFKNPLVSREQLNTFKINYRRLNNGKC